MSVINLGSTAPRALQDRMGRAKGHTPKAEAQILYEYKYLPRVEPSRRVVTEPAAAGA